MKKRIVRKMLSGLLVVAVLGITACGGSANSSEKTSPASEEKTSEIESSDTEKEATGRLAEIQKNGKIVVATSGNYAPFTFTGDNGELQGIDVDMMKAIGEKMGIEVEFTTGNIAGLLPALQDGKVDCIASAMSMTEERMKEVDFSEPYMVTQHIAVCREDDADKFSKGLYDMTDAKVGVIAGTPAETWLLEQSGYAEVVNYPGNAEAFLDLKKGNVDMYMLSSVVAQYYIKNDNTEVPLTLTGEPAVFVNNGIAIAKGESDLQEALNQALAELQKDGIMDEIGHKYIGSALPQGETNK